jgi:hypothetical protein
LLAGDLVHCFVWSLGSSLPTSYTSTLLQPAGTGDWCAVDPPDGALVVPYQIGSFYKKIVWRGTYSFEFLLEEEEAGRSKEQKPSTVWYGTGTCWYILVPVLVGIFNTSAIQTRHTRRENFYLLFIPDISQTS